jgi:3-oxoacyl-[acyl-carrier-protein] synthase-1
MSAPIFINAFSISSPLGADTATNAENLFAGDQRGLSSTMSLVDGRPVPVGRVSAYLRIPPGAVAAERSRSNLLILHCLRGIEDDVRTMTDSCEPGRVGVVVGNCTSGILEAETALKNRLAAGEWSDEYDYARQEPGDPALFLSSVLGVTGPAHTVSTACTSGAKAIASGARLIQADLCDVVLCGGADALCELTVNGFAALEAVSNEICNPFSRNRAGINIGEGAALFVLSREPADLRLAGWGESSDAYHISAPHPQGVGAEMSVRQALADAGLTPGDIGYLNLHGTATRLNDAMEALVVDRVFGRELPCSSTKALTGHMLGAAGSCEAAFVALSLLGGGTLPPHLWDGEHDPDLPPIALVDARGARSDSRYMMSCSYAFGGSNIALILGRE